MDRFLSNPYLKKHLGNPKLPVRIATSTHYDSQRSYLSDATKKLMTDTDTARLTQTQESKSRNLFLMDRGLSEIGDLNPSTNAFAVKEGFDNVSPLFTTFVEEEGDMRIKSTDRPVARRPRRSFAEATNNRPRTLTREHCPNHTQVRQELNLTKNRPAIAAAASARETPVRSRSSTLLQTRHGAQHTAKRNSEFNRNRTYPKLEPTCSQHCFELTHDYSVPNIRRHTARRLGKRNNRCIHDRYGRNGHCQRKHC